MALCPENLQLARVPFWEVGNVREVTVTVIKGLDGVNCPLLEFLPTSWSLGCITRNPCLVRGT